MAGLLNATQLDPNKVAGYDPLKATSGQAATTNATAVNSVGTGYTASQQTLSPESSASWQVAKNVAADSPLNTQAVTFADKQSNRRGLLNSSMAVGAAQDALYKNVMPMSQQDAATRAQSDAAYKASVDRASEFTAGAGNTASLNNSQVGTSVSTSNARAADETSKFNTGLEAQTSQINAGAGNQALRDTAGALNTQSLQSDQLAAQERQAQIQSETQKSIAQLNARTQVQLQQIQSNTTLTDTDKKLAASKIIAYQDNAFKFEIQKIQSNTTLSAEEKRNATTLAIAGNDQNTKILLNAADNARAMGLAQLNVDAQLKIANLDNGTKTELAKLTMANDSLVKTNASAAGLMQQTMVGLSQISVSTMDASGKQAATNNILTTLQNSLDAIKDVDSLRLSQYFPIAPQAANSAGNSDGAANGLLAAQSMPVHNIGNPDN